MYIGIAFLSTAQPPNWDDLILSCSVKYYAVEYNGVFICTKHPSNSASDLRENAIITTDLEIESDTPSIKAAVPEE
eukprot:5364052-Ditylum_brightwellii.AAC.1